ncbi:hypothetical protein EDB92DRAFT_1890924 [Lactarius akahatsu]|uniref:Uncharacterized protein n=1 Tax=Lactarius akahatsu TaxID=416441 RepID=A0AAD4LE08_9AGAM|nr:hypothetical protein EDB92DRAFT_1890924 [Lactarius akahatsu]
MVTSLSTEQLTGLVIFGSYFIGILCLFVLVVQSISERHRESATSGPASSWIYAGLALASFGYTWYYMISFMQWSFMDYERSAGVSKNATEPIGLERVANWLRSTALFEQAWTIVCDGPLRWWWSEQLCLFTVGFWTIFLQTKGKEHGVKHVWAYMLLGQLVAISVATNLFFLALVPPVKEKKKKGVSGELLMLVPHSLWHDYFLSNLLVMHAPPARTLYWLVALLSAAARVRTITVSGSLTAGPGTLWAVLKSHPAQASIGWDVVWTTISVLIWVRPLSVKGQLMSILSTAGWRHRGVINK